jgi:hypothetical protein
LARPRRADASTPVLCESDPYALTVPPLAPRAAMSNPFLDHPVLNSPNEPPARHCELDADGQPTQRTIESRRRAQCAEDDAQGRDRSRRVGDATQRYVAVLQQAEVRTNSGEGDQSPGRRGHEGVQGVKVPNRKIEHVPDVLTFGSKRNQPPGEEAPKR